MKNLAQTILIIVVILTTIVLVACSQSDKPAVQETKESISIGTGQMKMVGREVFFQAKTNQNKTQHPLVYKLWGYAEKYDWIENVNPWPIEFIGTNTTINNLEVPNWVQEGDLVKTWVEVVGESVNGITNYYAEKDRVKSEVKIFAHHIDSSQYITPLPRIVSVKKLDSTNQTAQEFEIQYCLDRFNQGIYKDCILVARFGYWPEGAVESQKTYCPEFTITSGAIDKGFVTIPNFSRTADTKLWLIISYAQTKIGLPIPMRTQDGAIMPLGVCSPDANIP